ncbi:MAG: RluA family pseudouridine synthase [Chloroflexota bacterium]
MPADIHPWLIYADDHLLAINKPAGLRTLPDGYHPQVDHVLSLLQPQFGKLWVVHRLDKDTSGILLLARSAQAHRVINQQFDHRQVEKTYHALILNSPHWQEIILKFPLRVNGDRHHRTVIDFQKGKPAITACTILETFPSCALLQVQPKTGRTHQIRAHLAHINHPILGDDLYARSGVQKDHPPWSAVNRLALHAVSIHLSHPASGEPLTITAPYAADFSAWLEQLRQG